MKNLIVLWLKSRFDSYRQSQIFQKMLKKYKDDNRPKGVCYDCKLPYSDFNDLIVPDDVWEKINPTFHECAGLLCPTCIGKRLTKIGLKNIKATFP